MLSFAVILEHFRACFLLKILQQEAVQHIIRFLIERKLTENLFCKEICDMLKKVITSGAFNIILCPLGIGDQVDHLIVLSALIRILKKKQPPSANVLFYEDLPYSASYELDAISSLAFERIGSNNASYIDVTNEMAFKQKLIGIYTSQGKNSTQILQTYKSTFCLQKR